MAKFKFIGEYAAGHDGVTINGATFVGHEPSEVPEASERKFRGHPCFEEVTRGKKAKVGTAEAPAEPEGDAE